MYIYFDLSVLCTSTFTTLEQFDRNQSIPNDNKAWWFRNCSILVKCKIYTNHYKSNCSCLIECLGNEGQEKLDNVSWSWLEKCNISWRQHRQIWTFAKWSLREGTCFQIAFCWVVRRFGWMWLLDECMCIHPFSICWHCCCILW